MSAYDEVMTKDEPTPWTRLALALVILVIVGWAIMTYAPAKSSQPAPSADIGKCATEMAAVVIAQKQKSMTALSAANFALLKCSQESAK